MNESSSFAAANTLSEIWPLSLNDGVQLPVNSGQDFRSVEHSVNDYISAAGESTVTELTEGGRKRRAFNSQNSNRFSKKKLKVSGSEGYNVDGWRREGETSSGGGSKATEEKGISEPRKDYIHVRARRGQATDRHSLAERARREKISERMKFLQDLIPGCNKIIGKALVLDEIINYIQSLQHQVEFLSMKLEVVNSDVSTGSKIGMTSSEDLNNSLPIEVQRTMFDQHQETDEAQGSQPNWLDIRIDENFDHAA